MTAVSATTCIAPFDTVSGCDVQVPLVQGGTCTYANFDYAASAPALSAVTDRITELLPFYASVHRGAGYASRISTTAYEDARTSVSRFVGAADDQVVVFTRNTTDSLNLLASAVPGDVVVYEISYANKGGEAANDLAINNPVPAEVAFVEAVNPPSVVSVDKGKQFGPLGDLRVEGPDGQLRPAQPADITNLRW